MSYLVYSEPEKQKYPIVLLVQSIRKDEIKKEYFDNSTIDINDVLVMDVHQSRTKKKTPVSEIKEYINDVLLPTFSGMGVEYVLVSDSEYFKVLTKASKVDVNLGYVLTSPLGDFKVVYVPNYRAIFYDPDKIRDKISQGMRALEKHINNSYQEPGKDIIHFEDYPTNKIKIQEYLEKFIENKVDLAIDIETFSLKHFNAGVGTITMCWNEHEGIAFPVDCGYTIGVGHRNEEMRTILRDFFERFEGKTIYHNISFDVTVLIYQLFMKHILDQEGLLHGLEVMLKNWDDTKLITYLATNSCAGNKLSLKEQAQEFAGNYAMGEDIKDITKIPLDTLLKYNLIDGLSTWFTYNKHYQTMVNDNQLDIYENLFKYIIVDILQMQLTGMPINMQRVKEVRKILQGDSDTAMQSIQNNPIIQNFIYDLNEMWVNMKNNTLKKKRVTLADAKETFNPNSDKQLQELLFNRLGLPVISLTDSKLPSTDGDTIKALLNHTNDPNILSFLKSLIDFKAVDKMLTSFIPAMENAQQGIDGWHYLFGNYNLGGTLSGRLSSSDPKHNWALF